MASQYAKVVVKSKQLKMPKLALSPNLLNLPNRKKTDGKLKA